MDLPVQPRQRLKAVSARLGRVQPHSRQTVAAPDRSRAPRAQAARAIVYIYLRNGAKQLTAQRVGRKNERRQNRDNVLPHKLRKGTRAWRCRERPIGRRHKTPGERDTLRLVAIQERRPRLRHPFNFMDLRIKPHVAQSPREFKLASNES